MPYDHAYEQLVARNYDPLYARLRDPSGDGAFYLALAREIGGPVLELGCGTGRLLLPIARAGIECVGLDASASMLALFREKEPPPSVSLTQGDMENFSLGDGRFRLITAPFRVFSHLLDVDSQLACLACVRRHLVPGGVFALDVFDPKFDRTALEEEPDRLSATFQADGAQIQRWESVRRDLSRQVMTIKFRFEGGAPERSGSAQIRLRWFYRYELEHLLARAGFDALQFFGGFDRRPWQAGSETVVLARAHA
jgi:SAM-dependent methyltransferase